MMLISLHCIGQLALLKHTGNDDLVRVVKVKTGKEKFTVRPILELKKI